MLHNVTQGLGFEHTHQGGSGTWNVRNSWACGTNGRVENAHQDLLRKNEGKRPLVDLGIDGRIKLKWTLKK
jgi:hypothetical protein